VFWDVTPYSPLKSASVLALLDAYFMLISYVAYSLALKMEVTCSSEMLLDFQQTIQLYIPEDGTLYNHCCENLKSCMLKNYLKFPRFIKMFVSL
jgi:hypothetical protein